MSFRASIKTRRFKLWCLNFSSEEPKEWVYVCARQCADSWSAYFCLNTLSISIFWVCFPTTFFLKQTEASTVVQKFFRVTPGIWMAGIPNYMTFLVRHRIFDQYERYLRILRWRIIWNFTVSQTYRIVRVPFDTVGGYVDIKCFPSRQRWHSDFESSRRQGRRTAWC